MVSTQVFCSDVPLEHRPLFQMSKSTSDQALVHQIVNASNRADAVTSAYLFKDLFQNIHTSMDPLQFLSLVLVRKTELLPTALYILSSNMRRKLLLDPLAERLSQVSTFMQYSYLLSFASLFCGKRSNVVIFFNEKKWRQFIEYSLNGKISLVEPSHGMVINSLMANYFAMPSDAQLSKARDILIELDKSNYESFHQNIRWFSNAVSVVDVFHILALSDTQVKPLFFSLLKSAYKRHYLVFWIGKGIELKKRTGVTEVYFRSFFSCFNRQYLLPIFYQSLWDRFVNYFITTHMIAIDTA